MRYMIGSASVPSLAAVQVDIHGAGMLLYPASWRTPPLPPTRYACDNGVYEAWDKNRRGWDQEMHIAWLGMLNKIPSGNLPEWVLLPDAVGDWHRTVELAGLYLPTIRHRGLPVAIALQDGCDFEQVMDFVPGWVFVAGSTEWKEANIAPACRFFHDRGIKVHVGRVNTRKRLHLCQLAGADSCDGTTLNKFRDANLPTISKALNFPLLPLFG